MKLSCVLALAAVANAQYFSKGWVPGQAVTAEHGVPSAGPGGIPARQQQPAKPQSLSTLLDLNNILNSGPVKGLFEKIGVNITQKLEEAAVSPWDSRIPLITDANYGEMVVNETMTPEEEEKRVWMVIVSAQTSRQEGISKFLDAAFDEAFNETMIVGDLPHVKWARIDYLNVTYITTKWNLWIAPSFVIIQDRGQTLRFYRPNQLRIAHGALREYLKSGAFMATPPWSSAFAPGGSREFVLDFVATWMTKFYLLIVRVPRWVMILASGSIASFAINLLHGFGGFWKKTPPATKPTTRPVAGAAAPAAPATAATTATAPASPSGAKQRKGKKK